MKWPSFLEYLGSIIIFVSIFSVTFYRFRINEMERVVYQEDQFRDEYTEDDYLNSSFGPNVVGHRFKDFVNPEKDSNNKVKKKIPVTESFTDSDSLDDMIRYLDNPAAENHFENEIPHQNFPEQLQEEFEYRDSDLSIFVNKNRNKQNLYEYFGSYFLSFFHFFNL